MLDVIICANFGVKELRGLGNTRGQILEFPIEMAGHLYNRAGATAQPVIIIKNPCWFTITIINTFSLFLLLVAYLSSNAIVWLASFITDIYTVSQKSIPNIMDCNSKEGDGKLCQECSY